MFRSIVLVKQVPDTANISGSVMKEDGTVNRSKLPAIFNNEDRGRLMALSVSALHTLEQGTETDAWKIIVGHAVDVASKPLAIANAASEVVRRDREIGELDLFLSSSGWDLWRAFGGSVERTSDRLKRWWEEPFSAKALLILDGLSLRELPWLLQEAKERGFTLHEVSAHGSELPGETDQFARALGFASRSKLQNNGGGLAHRLQPAQTETVDLPWKDCEALIGNAPNQIFWHHWPDAKLHDGSGAGQGLEQLTRNTAEQLTSDDFWAFVERLATGYMVFYVEHAHHVDVWRVLHGQRDLPAWMQEPDNG